MNNNKKPLPADQQELSNTVLHQGQLGTNSRTSILQWMTQKNSVLKGCIDFPRRGITSCATSSTSDETRRNAHNQRKSIWESYMEMQVRMRCGGFIATIIKEK